MTLHAGCVCAARRRRAHNRARREARAACAPRAARLPLWRSLSRAYECGRALRPMDQAPPAAKIDRLHVDVFGVQSCCPRAAPVKTRRHRAEACVAAEPNHSIRRPRQPVTCLNAGAPTPDIRRACRPSMVACNPPASAATQPLVEAPGGARRHPLPPFVSINTPASELAASTRGRRRRISGEHALLA